MLTEPHALHPPLSDHLDAMEALMETIPATLRDLAVPIGDLTPYRSNPRRGDLSAIQESLRTHGQYRPIVARAGTHEVLAGNHTLLAARELGWAEIAATFVECDDEQAAKIVLVDNRSNDLAGYDDAVLVELLEQVQADSGDLIGTGFTDADLARLLADATDEPVSLTEPDDVPDTPAEPVTQPGDVWELGEHRLICGDSTDPDTYERLLDEPAELIWTDPPYGVSYVGKTKDALTIQNDSMDVEALYAFLMDAFKAMKATTRAGAAWYVCAPHGVPGLAFSRALYDLEVWKHSLVWVKDVFVMGRSDYHYRHEAIYYGWTPGAARLYPVEDRSRDTVWEVPRPKSSREHPTMKPVELVSVALENSSGLGSVVLDPFGGSGSTLIAAHHTRRRARLIELDPHYADVICRRYQEHTGIQPVREADGQPHDFTS